MIIEKIKAFFNELGLNWSGKIISQIHDNEIDAKDEDFEKLKNLELIMDFGKEGKIVLSCEIDLLNFRIYGEAFDVYGYCPAGLTKESIKLCRERDVSEQWVKFQLENCDLVYATIIKKKYEEKKTQINNESERRKKQLERKIKYLNSSIDKVEEARKKEVAICDKFIKLAEEKQC